MASLYGLGFRKESDIRNLRFLLRAELPPAPKPRTRHWTMPLPAADQKATGTCVGHAGWHRLVTTPIAMDPTKIPTPFQIYRWCVQFDQWTDNDAEATAPDADLQAGTSTLGLMKALVKLGLISRYAWAYTTDDLILGVSHHGPVTIGIPFYDSMFEPDAAGLVRVSPTAKLAGGHEMLVLGWDTKTGLAEVLNSWGPTWGKQGRCYMAGETLYRLIDREDGEASSPVEVRPKT